MRRFLPVLGNALFAIGALIIGFTILALTVLPPVLRYQTYVVLSGSMEPTIHTGSVIVATAVDPETLQIGDIVTFVRSGDQENVTHRIVGVKGSAIGKSFVTQGDANPTPDPSEIHFNGLAGKVQLTIPQLGYVFSFIGSQQMRFLFIVVPGMLLLGSWLWEVWKPEPKGKAADEETLKSMAPPPSQPAVLQTAQHDIKIGVAADAAAVPLRQ